MPNPNTNRGLASISSLLGILSVVAGSLVVNDSRLYLDLCNSSYYNYGSDLADDVCTTFRMIVAASCLAILGGIVQVIFAIVISNRKGLVTKNMGYGSYITGFLFAVAAFAIAMYYNSSYTVELLRTDDKWNSRLLFLYCVTGINMIYCLAATIVIIATKSKPIIPPQPMIAVIQQGQQPVYAVQMPAGNQGYVYPPQGQYQPQYQYQHQYQPQGAQNMPMPQYNPQPQGAQR